MKRGFTLAEVLITLGIIGVVAAMTIPNLIANTKSQQYRSKLKKTISTLSQAARMSQAQYGFDYAGINKECGKNGESEHPEKDMTICAILNGTLTGATYYDDSKNLIVRKNNTTISYKPDINAYSHKYHIYILNDGTLVAINEHLGKNGKGCTLPTGEIIGEDSDYKSSTAWCFGFIDVNGTSLPNKEIRCTSGSMQLSANNCIVKTKDITDIYPIRFHDGIAEAGTAPVKYILHTAK